MTALDLSPEDYQRWLQTPYTQEEQVKEMRPEDGGYPRKAYARLRERNVLPASFVPTASVPKQAKAEPASSAFREGPGQGEALPAKTGIVSAPAGAEIDNSSGLAQESQTAALRVPASANSLDLAPSELGTTAASDPPMTDKPKKKPYRSSRKKKKQFRISLFEETAKELEPYAPTSRCHVLSAIIEAWLAKVSPEAVLDLANQCSRLGNLLNQTLHVIHREGADEVRLADIDAQFREAIAFIRRLSGGSR
jgi:hypothetical protein